MAKRPAWVRVLNATARGLAALRLDPVRLNPDRMVAKARRATGLDDFDGDSYREPLEIAVRDVHAQRSVTPFARIYVQAELVSRLSNRLRIVAALAADPSIAEQPVQRPIFIIGLPRTGTTLLHRMLAVDPANRAPITWEMDAPVPPPTPEDHATDPRIAQTAKNLKTLDNIAPEFRKIHELGATLPEECLTLLANGLTNVNLLIGLSLPDYREWVFAHDMSETYARHRHQLQLLQSTYPPRRWVLKAPFHLHGMGWLLKTYPDACIVQTHRDPLRVIPSSASLMMTMRQAFQDGITPAGSGEEMARDLALWLERGMAERARAEADPASRARFCDVHYHDLVADPIAAVRRIYRAFGDELGDEAEQRMRAFLDDNRQHKHGKHSYSLEQFELDPARTRERYAAYCERFDVPRSD